jgi:hypothetical protein
MGEFQHAGEAGMARIGDLGDWTPLAGLTMCSLGVALTNNRAFQRPPTGALGASETIIPLFRSPSKTPWLPPILQPRDYSWYPNLIPATHSDLEQQRGGGVLAVLPAATTGLRLTCFNAMTHRQNRLCHQTYFLAPNQSIRNSGSCVTIAS